jgi:hypothetical protein
MKFQKEKRKKKKEKRKREGGGTKKKVYRQWLIAQLVERSLSVMKDPCSNLGMDIC